ncbi:MAG: deoxyribose-phosphate aldolase, partial [Flavobacteriaceae bacterium]
MKIEKYIDHTLLKPTATKEEIIKLCEEAIEYNFYAVCVNSCYIPLVAKMLEKTDIKIAAVVGFPLGAMASETKEAEAAYCLEHGADEIDVVMNLGWLKSGQRQKVLDELGQLKKSIGKKVLKVIIETCYLDKKEIVIATNIVLESGADFVKTSTGFGSGGATFKDVALMKRIVGEKIRIKASGGVRDRETAIKYID